MQGSLLCIFFDIGQPGYDQLTPVITRYPLTSITWPYRGLKFTAHRGHMFFFKLNEMPNAGFPIGLRAHVRLTCQKTGQGFSEGLKLKIYPNYNLFSMKMFFAVFFCANGDC